MVFKKISCPIIFFAFLAIFFVRNLLLPIIADDYSYAFIWDGEGKGNLLDGIDGNRLQRVENFSDILHSQYEHYFTWGGRTIAHIFVQFFVLHGKIFFDFANVFAMAALIFLVFKIATGLKLREMKKIYLVWILAGLYFCLPSFLITTIWLTGACNYLWMTVCELLFLLPFVLKYFDKKFWSREKIWQTILMAFAGLIAGWSIEPGAAATGIVVLLLCLKSRREKNFRTWEKVGFVFFCIGMAILILSPGNFHRLAISQEFDSEFLAEPYTAEMFLINFVMGFLPVFLKELILFVPIIFYFSRPGRSEKISRFIAGFSFTSISVLFLMMFSPEFPERAGFSSTIFLMIASLAALKEILPELEKIYSRNVKKINVTGNIFLALWLLNTAGCLYVETDLHHQLSERMKFIEEHRKENLIVVKPLKIPAWSETLLGSRTWDEMTLWWGGDLESKETENRDIVFARYHGLKKIVTEKRPGE